VGSLFFTTAAWLQWLEALNGDVAQALGNDSPRAWRWFGWRPRNLGYLAYAEVSQRAASFAPRSVSWWVAVVNLLGSVAFQLSALYSFAGPEPAAAGALFWAGFYTAAGGVCFLLGSYLMVPELFDE
jgi:hypothetical protein